MKSLETDIQTSITLLREKRNSLISAAVTGEMEIAKKAVYQSGKRCHLALAPRQLAVYMDISFRTRKLEKLANSEKEQLRQLGKNAAKKFKRRLDDLRAARNLAELALLPGRLHPLTGDRSGELSLDLEHPNRLLLVASHDPVPVKTDGSLDWDAVTAVEIIEITDTHE